MMRYFYLLIQWLLVPLPFIDWLTDWFVKSWLWLYLEHVDGEGEWLPPW